MPGGSIKYGDSCVKPTAGLGPWYDPAWTDTIPDVEANKKCGNLFVQGGGTITKKTLDVNKYRGMLANLKKKSAYWYSLRPNGKFLNA